jgi:signal transduction histidine kinase
MRPIHWTAIDCVVGAVLALGDAAAVVSGLHGRAKLPFVLLFMVVIFTPVALRRRAPATAFGALLVIGVLLYRLPPSVSAAIFVAAAFVLYTVTVAGRRRTGAAALGLILAVMVFLVASGGSGRPRSDAATEFVPVALASVIAWMTGYSMRQRRLYVVTLQQRAASSAVAEERLRIARELHDVVAHSMSVIAVQAGYGQYVIDASPEGAKGALGAIQSTSRDALEEMRRMLGVLRQQDVTPGLAQQAGPVVPGQAPAGGAAAIQAPLAPAPGLAGLDRLVERTGGAGVQVTLDVAGHRRPAPAGVDLSAYRIIQEALTNVVRHAGTGAACLVSVRYTGSGLVIQVTDDGGLPVSLPSISVAAQGSGHGLIGMRERVHLCGGTFNAGPLPDGGFQVTAVLPLPPAGWHAPDDHDTDDGARAAAGAAPAATPAAAAAQAGAPVPAPAAAAAQAGAAVPAPAAAAVPAASPALGSPASGSPVPVGSAASGLPASGSLAPADSAASGSPAMAGHPASGTRASGSPDVADHPASGAPAVTGAATGNGGGRG